jgi:hypothetical protein
MKEGYKSLRGYKSIRGYILIFVTGALFGSEVLSWVQGSLSHTPLIPIKYNFYMKIYGIWTSNCSRGVQDWYEKNPSLVQVLGS